MSNAPIVDVQAAVFKYLDLTAQIKALTEQRKAIGVLLPMGRLSFDGSEKDLVVGEYASSAVSIKDLRRYVTEEIIQRCVRTTRGRTVKVVAKVKPKQKKARRKQ